MSNPALAQQLGSDLAEQTDHGLVVFGDLALEVFDPMGLGPRGQQGALEALLAVVS